MTSTCIVGAGPAGAVLGLLLARRGIAVTLLEAHDDFDREFRGDTLHPSSMAIMDELALAERLLELPHTTVPMLSIDTDAGPLPLVDFRRLRTPYPHVTILPQADFLEFVTREARRYPNFELRMGAHVDELVEDDGVVRGVRHRGTEVRALLTVAADGRASRMRRLADMDVRRTSPPMDVLWFRLPRSDDDPDETFATFAGGRILIILNRREYWQVGYVVPKGSYRRVRAAGLAELRRSVAELVPPLAHRVNTLADWKQLSLLSVESSRLKRWYRPGLLFIGDAAHVMSPVGGVGINYAIQDAVVTANLLARPLASGRLSLRDLHRVQCRRVWPTVVIQTVQRIVQRQILAEALDTTQPFRLPLPLRLLPRVPFLRTLPARIVGLGFWPVHVHPAEPSDMSTS